MLATILSKYLTCFVRYVGVQVILEACAYFQRRIRVMKSWNRQLILEVGKSSLKISTKMSDDYYCAVCTEVFYYPVTFPCKHSMCKQCFDAHVQNNGCFCHLCRKRLSNWLRNLKRTNEEIVNIKLWAKVQKKFPKLVKARRYNISDPNVSQNPLTPEKIPHNGRKIILAKPGEIRTEYEEWCLKQQEEIRLSEEKNFRLSENLIKLIEEDEKKEKENYKKMVEEQMSLDEELAKKLLATENSSVLESSTMTTSKDKSGLTETSNTSPCTKIDEMNQSIFGGSGTPLFTGPVQPTCSTPINKTQVTKKQTSSNIFCEYFAGPSTSKAGYLPLQNSLSNDSSEEKIYDDCAGSKSVVQDTLSRSSSGGDSIKEELCHFKPIYKSPTTPLKNGKTCIPQIVVAQKLSSSQSLDLTTCHDVIAAISNPDSDLSVEDLEQSLARENQLEADRLLAIKLQEEWDVSNKLTEASELKKEVTRKRRGSVSMVSSDYNLRKKKKKDLRKKVLLNLTQTTLDNMLIK